MTIISLDDESFNFLSIKENKKIKNSCQEFPSPLPGTYIWKDWLKLGEVEAETMLVFLSSATVPELSQSIIVLE